MSDNNTKKPADETTDGSKLKLPEVGGREVEEVPANILEKADGGLTVTVHLSFSFKKAD